MVVQVMISGAGCVGLIPKSSAEYLGDLGRGPESLCASLSSSIEWGERTAHSTGLGGLEAVLRVTCWHSARCYSRCPQCFVLPVFVPFAPTSQNTLPWPGPWVCLCDLLWPTKW